MADEKKPESIGLTSAVPVTVVLALLANLLYSHLSPYQDERPSNHPLKDEYPVAQDVDARLWQDPFAAVEGASKETSTEKLSISTSNGKNLDILVDEPKSHDKDQIYKGYGDEPNPDDDITVIAVTLPGGPYQDAAENRMRRRYAVLSGLANQGATPKDEQHIGYFHPDPDNPNNLQKNVAFEWWSREKSNNKKVLLLWVDESSLLGCPASKLQKLLIQTRPTKKTLGDVQLKDIHFKYTVIGPNSSTLLRDMLQEFNSNGNAASVVDRSKKECTYGVQPKSGKPDVLPVVYYSAGATASDYHLLTDVLGYGKGKENVFEYLREKGVTLYRTTATDNEMMDILVDELDLRQVKDTDRVVILSEWDTFYGRSMSEAFEHAWIHHAWKNGNKLNDRVEFLGKNYSYMRGLDGILPDIGDKTASVAEKKPDSKDQEKSDAGALIESPEGQIQKDYLRRLADHINVLDQDWKDKDKDKDNKKGVAAIGILGSDVHDKLMILEALRQYFPHKLFFTTDLEAIYNHPSKRRKYQSHNLLVASAFDLELDRELQGKIPPFRDSYQTAFFLATFIALKGEDNFEKIRHVFSIFIDAPDLQLSSNNLNVDYRPSSKWFLGYNRLPAPAFYLNADYRQPAEWFITHNPLAGGQTFGLKLRIEQHYKLPAPPRLFEIGRNHPIPLPMSEDIVLPKNMKDVDECSKDNAFACTTVHPQISSTSNLQLTPKGVMGFLLAALSLSFFSSWFREKLERFTKGVGWALIPAYILVWKDPTLERLQNWEAPTTIEIAMVWLFFNIVLIRVWGKVKIKPPYYLGLVVGVLLLLLYSLTPLWNTYIKQNDAEPFYWLEGVSIWPSQLLRLSVILFAGVFFWFGHQRIKKMQKDLQEQVGDDDIPKTFALPERAAGLGYWEVRFVGNWKINKEHKKPIYPNQLWEKYLGYFGSDMKGGFPGWLWRVMLHGIVFFGSAAYIIWLGDKPNVPARGDFATHLNFIIIVLAVLSTIFLTTWVVENARLCGRLIEDLSTNRSKWNSKAKNWAISKEKVAPECVQEWLDIKLVERLTKTLQPLIFGPVVCVALLILGRSSLTDDWNLPWGLEMVFIAMLLYSIFAEVFLQLGAKDARKKAIVLLSNDISEQRNHPNPESEVVIKRIEAEIERIKNLREGAFRPWYEWPLLQSFGGLGVLKYIAMAWESGGF